MALIVCPHCGTQVSDKAKQCPNCGNNPHKKPRRKWKKRDYAILFSVIGAVIAIGVVLFLLLRPDPFLKKGRDYISEDFVQKYKEHIQSKVDRYIDLSDFDIRDFISEEWDRKACIEHFNIPLKDDPVYSICAYSFYREPKDDAVLIDDGVPTMTCLITQLLKVETLFVVFRHDEPILIKDRDGLAQKMESNICVVKKDGSTIHLDAHDCLELDYIEANSTVGGNPDFEKFGKEMSAYFKQRYGDYEVVCSCNSVDDVIQQHSSNMAEEAATEESGGGSLMIDGFEYNARLLDYDGDYTNIRNAPRGMVVDKLYGYKGANEYYMYLSYNNGDWWQIRDCKVYDKTNGKVQILEGNQCWLHNSCFKMIGGEQICINLYGRIGGDNSAWLKIDNGQGSYHFLNYTRNVQIKEYNPSTKKLIVHGYATGSGDYIGEFDGSFDGTTYQGTFTNYKGAQITFHLSKE